MQNDTWDAQMRALGAFIRAQRGLADLSLRDLSKRTNISNAYLSQLERGLHQPSLRVVGSIADALNLSAEALLAQAGLARTTVAEAAGTGPAPKPPPDPKVRTSPTEAAILHDPDLTDTQRQALISVYRDFTDRTRQSAAQPAV